MSQVLHVVLERGAGIEYDQSLLDVYAFRNFFIIFVIHYHSDDLRNKQSSELTVLFDAFPEINVLL